MKFYQLCSQDIERTQNFGLNKDNDSDIKKRRMMFNNPKLDLAKMNADINLVKFYQLVLRILSGNTILA